MTKTKPEKEDTEIVWGTWSCDACGNPDPKKKIWDMESEGVRCDLCHVKPKTPSSPVLEIYQSV